MDTSTLPWVFQQFTVVSFVGIAIGLPMWRDSHQRTVASTRDALTSALRAANMPHKVAAAEIGMDEGTFSRRLSEGGAFLARLVDLGIRHPVFGAALVGRLGELLQVASESREERVERLLRDIQDRLPQLEPMKCEVTARQRGSSAA